MAANYAKIDERSRLKLQSLSIPAIVSACETSGLKWPENADESAVGLLSNLSGEPLNDLSIVARMYSSYLRFPRFAPWRSSSRCTSRAGTCRGVFPIVAARAAQTPAACPVAMQIGITRYDECAS